MFVSKNHGSKYKDKNNKKYSNKYLKNSMPLETFSHSMSGGHLKSF
jgi:hypothetical protein